MTIISGFIEVYITEDHISACNVVVDHVEQLSSIDSFTNKIETDCPLVIVTTHYLYGTDVNLVDGFIELYDGIKWCTNKTVYLTLNSYNILQETMQWAGCK